MERTIYDVFYEEMKRQTVEVKPHSRWEGVFLIEWKLMLNQDSGNYEHFLMVTDGDDRFVCDSLERWRRVNASVL